MKIFFWLALSFLTLESLGAVTGLVLEKGTKKTLANVNLFVLPQKIKITTDPHGAFTITEPLEPGSELVINLSGYKKFTQQIASHFTPSKENSPPDPQSLILYVERESYQYLETTVTALRDKKVSQKTLKQEEFLSLPGSGGDPVKAVQNLPGVNRSTGGDARVIIQGSDPEDTKYNLEGHDVPLIFHFGGISSIVTPEAVESVDYFSAGYGSELGRALGGHVGLNVRNPKVDRHHAFAFLDAYNTGGLIEGPVTETSSYLVTGRYSYVGEVLKAAMKDNKDFNLVVAPSYYDFTALYRQKLSPTEEFRLLTLFSKDRLEFVLNKPLGNDPKTRGTFYQQTLFDRVIPEWRSQWSDARFFKASAAYGRNDIMVDIGSNYFHLQNRSLTTQLQLSTQSSIYWKSTMGIDMIDDWYNVALRLPATYNEGGISNPLATGELKETEVKGHDTLLGAYWSHEIKLEENPQWTLLPQIRADRFAPTKENLLQPRLSMRYQWDESLLLRAGIGSYFQLPEPQEYDAYWGNPDLKSPHSYHYVIGMEKDFRQGQTEGLTVSGAIFLKTLDHLVQASSELVERNQALVFENFNNEGTGTIKGIETQILWSESRDLKITGTYTFLQSRRKKPGEIELPSQYDQTHSLNLLLSYNYHQWLLGGRFRYVTGNPMTPIQGATLDMDNDVYIPTRGPIFSARNKSFLQLDVRMDRKWIYDTWILSAYLDIQNLTNSANQEGLSYSYDYSQKQVITGIPFLPSLGIKGEF